MPRLFPRPVEAAVRVLKQICDDATNPTPLRARAAEIICYVYGLVSLPEDSEPRHRSIKQIVSARVEASRLDRNLAGRLAETRKQTREQKRLEELLKPKPEGTDGL